MMSFYVVEYSVGNVFMLQACGRLGRIAHDLSIAHLCRPGPTVYSKNVATAPNLHIYHDL